MICSPVYRDHFVRPSPPDSTSSWLIFRHTTRAQALLASGIGLGGLAVAYKTRGYPVPLRAQACPRLAG
jgi:hypothetical protein